MCLISAPILASNYTLSYSHTVRRGAIPIANTYYIIPQPTARHGIHPHPTASYLSLSLPPPPPPSLRRQYRGTDSQANPPKRVIAEGRGKDIPRSSPRTDPRQEGEKKTREQRETHGTIPRASPAKAPPKARRTRRAKRERERACVCVCVCVRVRACVRARACQ